MKTKLLILGMAITFPSLVSWAEAPRGPGRGPQPAAGPHDGRGGEVHDDPHHNPIFHSLLRAIDTDGDGVISMAEMNHAPEALLMLDKDGDGKLSNAELLPPKHHGDGPKDGPKDGKKDNGEKPEKAKRPDAEKGDKSAADKGDAKDGDDDRKPRREKGPGDGPVLDEQRSALVDAIDTNHDGKISAEEIAASRANLKKLDQNHDGKLSPWEYGKPHHP